MPVLKNARHEKFAQALAKGSPQLVAYESAGYKPNRSAASKLQTSANIGARVDELLLAASQKVTVTIAEVVNELAKLGFSNAQDYVQPGVDGLDQTIDVSQLTREQAAAVSEVAIKDNVRDREVKVKLYDKRAALVDLGKHLGAFKEAEAAISRDIQINVNFISPDGKRTKTIEHKS